MLKNFELELKKSNDNLSKNSFPFYRVLLQKDFNKYSNRDINTIFRLLNILVKEPKLKSLVQSSDFDILVNTLKKRKRDKDLLRNLKLFVVSMFKESQGEKWLKVKNKNIIFDPRLVEQIFVLLIEYGELNMAGEVDKYLIHEEGRLTDAHDDYLFHKLDYLHLLNDYTHMKAFINKVEHAKAFDSELLRQVYIRDLKWKFDAGMYGEVLEKVNRIEKNLKGYNVGHITTIYFKAGMAALYDGKMTNVEQYLTRLKNMKGKLAELAYTVLLRRLNLEKKDPDAIQMSKALLNSIASMKNIDDQIMYICEVLLVAGVMNNKSLIIQSFEILKVANNKNRPLKKSLYYLRYVKFYKLWNKIVEKVIADKKAIDSELKIMLEEATQSLGAKHSDIMLTKRALRNLGFH
jgi:hypothetical protein